LSFLLVHLKEKTKYPEIYEYEKIIKNVFFKRLKFAEKGMRTAMGRSAHTILKGL
jgi:hypothetical protein